MYVVGHLVVVPSNVVRGIPAQVVSALSDVAMDATKMSSRRQIKKQKWRRCVSARTGRAQAFFSVLLEFVLRLYKSAPTNTNTLSVASWETSDHAELLDLEVGPFVLIE